MLPTVDAILMALFLAGLIAYVVIAGRRSGEDADERTPASPTPIGPGPGRSSAGDGAPASGSRRSSPAQLAILAALLSFLAPGLGQFLVGARLRGALFLAGWVVLAIVSGALHSPVALILMVVAGIDAYLLARSGQDPSGEAGSDRSDPLR